MRVGHDVVENSGGHGQTHAHSGLWEGESFRDARLAPSQEPRHVHHNAGGAAYAMPPRGHALGTDGTANRLCLTSAVGCGIGQAVPTRDDPEGESRKDRVACAWSAQGHVDTGIDDSVPHREHIQNVYDQHL